MNNALASFLFILFISGSLLPKIGMEQSFKVNELLRHFKEHEKIERSNFSFVDFLWLHYLADSKHNNTSKYPSLPTIDFNGSIGCLIPEFYFFCILSIFIFIFRRKNLHNLDLYHFFSARVLIAPPKA